MSGRRQSGWPVVLGFVVVALDLLFASGVFAVVARDLVELEGGRVVNQSVYGGDSHAWVGEDCIPAREGLVGG